MNPILKQLKKFEGFNGMVAEDVADALHKLQKIWIDVFWSPSQEDTVYVIPKAKMNDKLELEIYRADLYVSEIDTLSPAEARNLEDTGFPSDNEYIDSLNKFLKKAKGRAVLRLWWD